MKKEARIRDTLIVFLTLLLLVCVFVSVFYLVSGQATKAKIQKFLNKEVRAWKRIFRKIKRILMLLLWPIHEDDEGESWKFDPNNANFMQQSLYTAYSVLKVVFGIVMGVVRTLQYSLRAIFRLFVAILHTIYDLAHYNFSILCSAITKIVVRILILFTKSLIALTSAFTWIYMKTRQMFDSFFMWNVGPVTFDGEVPVL